MTINKITHETRNKIISKSVSPLPNNPGRAGYKADAVKKAMFDFVTGSEDSILAEINRIVDELNVCLSGFGIEGIKISLANKADKDEIPDVSNFITRLVSDLENYYLKSETYSQQEIDNKISSIPKFNTKVVTALPTDNISNTTVYLLKSDSTDTNNIYTEYIYAGSSWEVLGSQRFDLSGYLTIDVFNTTISKYYTSASVDTLLQNKVDKVEGKGLSTNDYTTEEKNKLKGIETGAQVNTVNKVNGKTGDIELTAEDVGALPSDTEMFSGSYNDLTDKPDLFDGNYNDLSNKPTIPTTAEDVNALPDSTKFATGINLTINETDYKVTVQLIDQDGNSIGSSKTIDLPLESVVVGGSYDETTKKVVLSLQSGTDISFSVADLVSGLQTEITAINKLASDLVDDRNSVNKFVTQNEKDKLNGIEAGANKTVVDDAFSVISTNPIQNKLVTEKLNEKVNKVSNETIGGVKTFSKQPVIADDVTESWQARGIVSADAIRKYLRDNYQEKLVEGNNITIDGNIISANLEGSTPIVTLPSPVVIYDLPSGVYQLPAGCELYCNDGDERTVTYDNTAVTLMIVNSITNPDGRVDKLFYLFAEADGQTESSVGTGGSFIVGKVKSYGGSYHIVGTNLDYVGLEDDGWIGGNKSFLNPVKYYHQYESLDTSLNDRTLVDAQWVNSVLAGKGFITSEDGRVNYVSRAGDTIYGGIAIDLQEKTSNDDEPLILRSNVGATYIGFYGINAINGELDYLGRLGISGRKLPIFEDPNGNQKQLAFKDDIPDTSAFVTTNTAQTITGKKTFSGNGLTVSGRPIGSGDDEGIVVSPAPNNYAGICLGNPNGKRTVLYLHANGTSVWRFSEGGGNFDLTHPGKSGTVATTADIPHLYQHIIYLTSSNTRLGFQIYTSSATAFTPSTLCSFIHNSGCTATSSTSANWFPVMGGSSQQSLSFQGVSVPTSGSTTMYMSYVRDGYTFGSTSGDVGSWTIVDRVTQIF